MQFSYQKIFVKTFALNKSWIIIPESSTVLVTSPNIIKLCTLYIPPGVRFTKKFITY